MIVVTGLGRSGTSFVAALYRELGFEPGGRWFPEVRAGLEDHEVVRLNEQLVRDLGVGVPERELSPRLRKVGEWAPWLWRRRQRLQPLPETFGLRPQVAWERFPRVVARYGPRLRKAAAERVVVKHPRFCWTIGVWAAAGAEIDHVLVCLRNLDAILASRRKAGMLEPTDRSRNAFLYGLGLCIQSLVDHDIPHDFVRFPRMLEEPGELRAAMRFPEEVSDSDFQAAFENVRDRGQVGDWR